MHLADKKTAKGNSKYINGTLISSLRAKTVIAASKIFLRSEKKYSAQQGKKFCAARNKIPCSAERNSMPKKILRSQHSQKNNQQSSLSSYKTSSFLFLFSFCSNIRYSCMDGRMDGPMDGRMDGPMDGRTDGPMDGRTVAHTREVDYKDEK